MIKRITGTVRVKQIFQMESYLQTQQGKHLACFEERGDSSEILSSRKCRHRT